MSAILFLDVETTGLNPEIHGIHQLAGIIEIDGVIVQSFDFKMQPFEDCEIDEAALAISKTERSALAGYPEESEIMNLLENIIYYTYLSNKGNRIHIAGWRAPEFDVRFLKKLFLRVNHNVPHLFHQYFYEESIDIKSIAASKLMDRRKYFQKFNLEAVARSLEIDIKEEELHSAKYDTYLAYSIYNIFQL